MNKQTYYLIADIIQRYRTWIIVKDTELLVEMGTLTRRDVEYIIEKASFGIIKLELSDYEY